MVSGVPTASWERRTVVQFGERLPGRTYQPRPGAYALVRNGLGEFLTVETPIGIYLPGGGLKQAESFEEGLRRELLEETGYEI